MGLARTLAHHLFKCSTIEERDIRPQEPPLSNSPHGSSPSGETSISEDDSIPEAIDIHEVLKEVLEDTKKGD
jgi:hypothetical protein